MRLIQIMRSEGDTSPDIRISDTHLHALRNGAVITLPFHIPDPAFRKYGIIPGNVIDLRTQSGDQSIRCRILDIESAKPSGDSLYSVRVTLRQSEEHPEAN